MKKLSKSVLIAGFCLMIFSGVLISCVETQSRKSEEEKPKTETVDNSVEADEKNNLDSLEKKNDQVDQENTSEDGN